MPVKIKSKMWEIVERDDLDAFIEEHMGRPWSCQQNGMHGNDSIAYYEAYKDPRATEVVEAWLASPIPRCPGRIDQPGYAEDVRIGTADILCELCNRGILEEGILHVYIAW